MNHTMTSYGTLYTSGAWTRTVGSIVRSSSGTTAIMIMRSEATSVSSTNQASSGKAYMNCTP
ncbi:hypothetical protein [Amycolatopsis sp. NBRC 101858]|uniref:hypothetical protein n=1 Tax=Amycolatopsis sp. NBRC 101858 TaxID=3032200 RepID=UPI0025535D1F|nr:hypothetical protein [Amycolatopsis sp. NBRC 101858]